MDYIVYTDGSCLGNPGAGGWANIIVDCSSGEIIERSGGEKQTTNNRMEMTAAIVALSEVAENTTVELYTDSQYLKNAFTKGWLTNWKRNGWLTAQRKPVLNQDLWRKLDKLMSTREVEFQWVKGHAGNKYNERCDEMARGEATKYQKMR